MPKLFGYKIPSAVIGGATGLLASVLLRLFADWMLFQAAAPGDADTVEFHQNRARVQQRSLPIIFIAIYFGKSLGSLSDQGQPRNPIDRKATRSIKIGSAIGLSLAFFTYQYYMYQLKSQVYQMPEFENTVEYQSQRVDLFKMAGVITFSFGVMGALIGLGYARFTSKPQEAQEEQDQQDHAAAPGHAHAA